MAAAVEDEESDVTSIAFNKSTLSLEIVIWTIFVDEEEAKDVKVAFSDDKVEEVSLNSLFWFMKTLPGTPMDIFVMGNSFEMVHVFCHLTPFVSSCAGFKSDFKIFNASQEAKRRQRKRKQ